MSSGRRPWVYEEIEEAIRHALAGNLAAEIKSRDGRSYVVAELVERWELDEELLEVYVRPTDDRSYRAWPGALDPGQQS